MRKTLAALLALLLLPAVARAEANADSVTLPLVVNYDLDSTSYIFCKSVGVGQNADFNWKDQFQPVTTSGAASTTVAAVTAATNGPFDNLAVGSLIRLNIPDDVDPAHGSVPTYRYLTAKASDDSVTVNSNVTIGAAGITFQYLTQSCGTTSSSGWFSVQGWRAGTALIEVAQINTTTGVGYTLQCKHAFPWATAVSVITYTSAITAVGTVPLVWSEPYDYCRVGLKLDTTDDGGDLTTNAEQIFLTVVGRK